MKETLRLEFAIADLWGGRKRKRKKYYLKVIIIISDLGNSSWHFPLFAFVYQILDNVVWCVSGHSMGWWLGSWAAMWVGVSPASVLPSSLSLPSQHPSLSCLQQLLRHTVVHSPCEENGFLPVSTCPATGPHPGVCWVEIWLWVITWDTGLQGGSSTQVFLLERWQSRCFFIICVSYILSILC